MLFLVLLAPLRTNCFDNKRQLETRQGTPCNGFQVTIATQAYHQIAKTPMIALQAESG